MLTATQRLQPRSADIASKVMDGEAIIINLSNGVYYSMDKVGGFIWEQITATRTVADTVAAVSARYEVSQERAKRDVERLVAELLREDVIEPFDGGPSTASVGIPAAPVTRLPYEPPALNIYRDMGDLLALDPPTPGLDSPWQDAEEARS
jgi:hypothetical protein